MTKDNDPINHPSHYTAHPSGIECIQITEHMGFNLGNAVKYIWRCDLKKDAVEDLKKAIWYIQREIDKREGQVITKPAPTQELGCFEWIPDAKISNLLYGFYKKRPIGYIDCSNEFDSYFLDRNYEYVSIGNSETQVEAKILLEEEYLRSTT